MRYARPAATLFFCLLGSSSFAADDDVALGARAFHGDLKLLSSLWLSEFGQFLS